MNYSITKLGRDRVFIISFLLISSLLLCFSIPAFAAAPDSIGIKAAKAVVLNHAGLNESDVVFHESKYDVLETEYEIEFVYNGFEYDYEVNALTGQIVGYDKEQIPYVNVETGLSAGNTPTAPSSSTSPAAGTESQSSASETTPAAVTTSASVTVPPSENTSDNTTKPAVVSNAPISSDEAKAIAFKHAGVNAADAKAVKCHKDRDDGITVYEIEFYTSDYEYDYDINASDGSISKFDREAIRRQPAAPSAKPDKPVSSDTSALISSDDAKAIAFKHAGVNAADAKAVKCQKDRDDGITVYEIEFYTSDYEYEYDINASDGSILKFDSEAIRRQPAAAPAAKPDKPVSSDTSALISADNAKTIAFKHAGVNAADAKAVKCQMDRDDGITVYEIEFYTSDYEYEYDINASDGNILKFDSEAIIRQPAAPTASQTPTENTDISSAAAPVQPAAPAPTPVNADKHHDYDDDWNDDNDDRDDDDDDWDDDNDDWDDDDDDRYDD